MVGRRRSAGTQVLSIFHLSLDIFIFHFQSDSNDKRKMINGKWTMTTIRHTRTAIYIVI